MTTNMSASELYISALIQNNGGVLHLENGEFEAARDAFRKALDTLTLAIISESSIGCRASTQWSNNAPVINSVSSGSETPTFLYRRGLVMVPGGAVETGGCENNDGDFSVESSAMLFNMALSHHLVGLATNRSDVLERALKFYEISNNIRQNKDEKDLDILDLAIANNVGQAQHEFCNYGTARECFDLLTRRLQLFNSYGMICLLAQCDCEGFVLNAMLEQPTMAAAA